MLNDGGYEHLSPVPDLTIFKTIKLNRKLRLLDRIRRFLSARQLSDHPWISACSRD
jgi:hypothetical protein